MQMFLAIPSLSSCVIVFWNTAQVHIALCCYKAIADINKKLILCSQFFYNGIKNLLGY